ncbi:MAG: heparan-alpha-glucosaminide N-acetyltransferase domain-containing protein [Vicinamibacteraceae bacterium]
MTSTQHTASVPSAAPDAARSAHRRVDLDWMRGLAVVIMIGAHVLGSWTRPADKTTEAYSWTVMVAGMAAPMFLFTAGVAVALAGAGRVRRGSSVADASRSLVWRGCQIFGLAFLFRVQSWLLAPGAPAAGLLKVDILNIMGPALVGAAWLWGRSSSRRWRIVTAVAAAALFGGITPLVRSSELLGVLPDAVEWYLRPSPRGTNFTLFPWAGFVFAGLAAGEIMGMGRGRAGEARVSAGLLIAGALGALLAYGASYLPAVFEGSTFGTSAPSFFGWRVGLLAVILGGCYFYTRRWVEGRWSALVQFGRTSLFVYWIHVEMVYGVFSGPLHRQLPLVASLGAFVVFALFLLGLSILKTRGVAWYRSVQSVGAYRPDPAGMRLPPASR